MPIGVVTDADFQLEITRSNKVTEPAAEIKDVNNGGRGAGDMNVPDSLRKVIGEESALNGHNSAKKLAKMFDVSSSSVSAYANGATSTSSYKRNNSELLKHINESKNRVARRATSRLNEAIKNITPEKLADANLKDLAIVAKAMSGVVKDMEPSNVGVGTQTFNGPSIVMYNPGFRKEESFDTIDITPTES